jgi:PilZ domain
MRLMRRVEDGTPAETRGTASSGLGHIPERRHMARRSGLWVAEIQTAEGERISCLLLDLSNAGARIVPRRPLTESAIVTLTAPVCGARRGRVAWVTKSHVGLQFLGDTIDSKFRPF